jgi:GNAT superfamily N-acetyltransferase
MLETHPWSDAIVSIGADNVDCFCDHLLRLDADERLQRFCHQASDLCLRDYVARLDLSEGKIIGCFDGGKMRGAVELRHAGAVRSMNLEATFSVEKVWQGQGIEMALVLRAISIARAMGGRHILIDRLGSRERLRRIVAQFDAEVAFGNDDCKAWLPLVETGPCGPTERSLRNKKRFASPPA